MAKSRFGLKIRKHPCLLTLEVAGCPFYLRTGDQIVVDTNRGEELGTIVKMAFGCERHHEHEEFKIHKIIRKATAEDKTNAQNLIKQEHDYFLKVNQLIEQRNVNLKIISAELLFNNKKLIIYYRLLEEDTEDNKNNKKKKPVAERPNIKDLHRELFNLLGINLELKEMGNRASAKVVGGTGHCGCNLCCTTFLSKPRHVSIKMAKEQALAINIPKLTGICGKLMCCLSYENTQYEQGVLADTLTRSETQTDNLLEYAKMFKEKET